MIFKTIFRSRTAVRVVAAIFGIASFAMTACNDDDGPVGPLVEWDLSKPIYPDQEGNAVLLLSGAAGTSWTAEIISGGDWVSFGRSATAEQSGISETSGTVGKGVAGTRLLVYYWPNSTPDERSAVIRFAYQGAEPVALELVQNSAAGNRNIYQTGKDKVWPEIPAQLTRNTPYIKTADLIYVTHTAPLTDPATDRTFNARNYTLCFDKTKFGAWWVAYPLHKVYTGSGRNESWTFDPKIPSEYQADLTHSYTDRNLDRGHQIPNADRSANLTMQAQTYYFSNMTPQNSQLNQKPWARLEAKARDSWMCSDTLYVVTGACWQTNTTNTTTDAAGKACPIPDHYFKVFVRTVAGNVREEGDELWRHECKSIGFWVANADGQGEAKDWVKSVAEIEQLTGFEFFPTVSDAVKEQKDPASWGL
ncbi:MAG: DNA/RNA non-specific endonuclease [Alistipes senegalensis]|nr:DNA/RNA non-specific endonuclease [Bacteroides cellulosilyticus]MCM1352148.1 DNA/RNA non-specific endonuclease [Alistipes senegalensis]